MAVDQDLLKPFLKISIRDLVQKDPSTLQMVWIQGDLTSENISQKTFQLADCENLGHSVTVSTQSCKDLKLSVGNYYQVLGAVENRTNVRAVKVVEIESQIIKEMWPLELEDFQRHQ